ncbi:hypothetical protein Bbelb_012890 [Branchiostoma belcheri]|nr:hypothetical protein Bbelb_012890 [Branchiostoma belcheri]
MNFQDKMVLYLCTFPCPLSIRRREQFIVRPVKPAFHAQTVELHEPPWVLAAGFLGISRDDTSPDSVTDLCVNKQHRPREKLVDILSLPGPPTPLKDPQIPAAYPLASAKTWTPLLTADAWPLSDCVGRPDVSGVPRPVHTQKPHSVPSGENTEQPGHLSRLYLCCRLTRSAQNTLGQCWRKKMLGCDFGEVARSGVQIFRQLTFARRDSSGRLSVMMFGEAKPQVGWRSQTVAEFAERQPTRPNTSQPSRLCADPLPTMVGGGSASVLEVEFVTVCRGFHVMIVPDVVFLINNGRNRIQTE